MKTLTDSLAIVFGVLLAVSLLVGCSEAEEPEAPEEDVDQPRNINFPEIDVEINAPPPDVDLSGRYEGTLRSLSGVLRIRQAPDGRLLGRFDPAKGDVRMHFSGHVSERKGQGTMVYAESATALRSSETFTIEPTAVGVVLRVQYQDMISGQTISQSVEFDRIGDVGDSLQFEE